MDDPVGLAGRLDSGEVTVEEAVTWLEADVWAFRTGYAKAKLFRRLAQRDLTDDHARRLRAVVLHHVDVGPRWELREAATLARAVADDELRDALRDRLRDVDPSTAMRAFIVLLRIRRGLRADDLDVARAVLLATAARPRVGSSSRLPGQVRAAWSVEWGHELQRIVAERGPDASAARRLLDVMGREFERLEWGGP